MPTDKHILTLVYCGGLHVGGQANAWVAETLRTTVVGMIIKYLPLPQWGDDKFAVGELLAKSIKSVHTWMLVAMVVWLQASLDLRSSTFVWWVLATTVAIIVDFSVIEILEHQNTATDMWGGLWAAATPLVALMLGTIGGMYVRD